MSLSTNSQAANDPDLQARIMSAVYSEAANNPDLKGTQFAQQVRGGYAPMTGMYWGVANSVGAAYEAGLLNGRGAPGHDVDVITDADITAAVVANWPPDPEPVQPVP